MKQPAATTINRIDSLDYLRGLAALGIMCYHMYLFTYGEADSSSVFAKIKIYGVSIFYVLSGLTLYLVSFKRFSFTKPVLKEFYIKRFFRIVPLLWMATALTMLVAFQPEYLGMKKLIANITIIPGAIKPETFIANGAWSIGDELFFYMMFPFMLLLIKRNKWLFYGFTLFSLAILAYFSYNILNPVVPLGQQWAAYVNPVGQMFYFVMGITLGVVERDMKKFGLWAVAAIVVVCALVVLYPVTGEPVQLVTGENRLVLTGLVVLLCFLFYKCDFDFLPEFGKRTLHFLGQVSFSLYLIHPIIYAVIKMTAASFFAANPLVHIGLTMVFSLVLSYFNYTWFEMYFIRKGKDIAARAAGNVAVKL